MMSYPTGCLPEPRNGFHNIASVRFPAEITARNRHADVPDLESKDIRILATHTIVPLQPYFAGNSHILGQILGFRSDVVEVSARL